MLQPTATPQAQIINTPNVSQQNVQGLLQGIQAGQEANIRSRQQNVAEQQLAMQQQLQPGVLAGQSISNQGGLLANEKAAQDLAMSKYQQQKHMDDVNAYQAAQKQGASPEAALDAMQQSMMSHDPELALKMADSRQALKDKIREGNVKAVTDSGNLMHAIMNAAPEQNMKPLDLYTKQYKQIQKQDPDAPSPATFKGDNEAFVNAYVMPTMATALPVAKQQALDLERSKDDKLYAAQSLVKQTTQDLQSAINAHGANSEQAKAAATAAQQAQQAVRALPGQGIMGAIQNKVMGSPNGSPGGIMSNLSNIFSAPQAAPQQAAPAAPAIPQGRVTVKAPDGTVGHIPADQLQEALKAGYTQ